MDETNLKPNFPQPIYSKPRGMKKRIAFFTCGIVFLIMTFACASIVIIAGFSGSTKSSDDLGVSLTEKTSSFGDSISTKTAKIAIVDISGAINYSISTDALPTGANNRTVIAQLNRARNDKDVKAIIVRFNTPGGAVSAAEPICKAMKDLNNTKPVYAFIDTEGASLGYLLPNCAKYIYSRPDSITGSIGVRADLQDLSGILTNIGAKQMTVTNTAGVQKTQDGLFDKNSAEFKQFQSMLDESYDYFLNKVWEGRKIQNNGLTFEKLKTYANGSIYSGLQAKKIGLVDEIGYQDDVINSVIQKESSLKGDSIEIVEYQIDSNPFAGIFGASLDLYSIIKGNHVQTKKVQLMMMSEI